MACTLATGCSWPPADSLPTPPFHRQWLQPHALPPQIEEEEARAKAEYKEEREVAKAQAKHEKKWEKTRDERVGSWRDFVAGKATKKQKTGGLKVGGRCCNTVSTGQACGTESCWGEAAQRRKAGGLKARLVEWERWEQCCRRQRQDGA